MQLERLQPYARGSETTKPRRRLRRFALECFAAACVLFPLRASAWAAEPSSPPSTVAPSPLDRQSSTSASAAGASAAGASAAGAPALPAWARAYAQGHWSAAIELLEIIPEASRTAWHWLHLARANEKRTQLVEAFAAYERLLDVAAEGATIAGMKDVERQARAESSALSHRIPWAEVALEQGLPTGALVFVDQQWLEPSRLRSPYPVNPGWHTFLVESNGSVLGARRVFFEEGQNRVVPLNVLENADSGGALPAGAMSDNPARSAPDGVVPSARVERRRALAWHAESPALDGDRPGSLRQASYVSLGVGLCATGIGTGLALAYSNTGDPIKLVGATASYAIGFGGLVTGGIFWLLYRDAEKTSVNVGSVQIEPRLYPSGAAIRGTF
jgi:hypothetical protein